jgi:hypothetical protein
MTDQSGRINPFEIVEAIAKARESRRQRRTVNSVIRGTMLKKDITN